MNGGPRMLSEPVRLHWQGWESDTFTLQRSGWEISANQDVRGKAMEIALRHPQSGAIGFSQTMQWEYGSQDPRWLRVANLPIAHMKFIGNPAAHLVPYVPMNLGVFSPIDCEPSFAEVEVKSIEDMVHFARVDSKRLILPEPTVDELMGRILEMQEAGRQEYFLKQVKEQKARTTLRAQIVSLAA